MPIASVNGTKLHYHVTGDGMPLIFVHPPLLNQEVFNYQIAQLSDRYKVVTFDIRGHGQSISSDTPLTYPLIAEDMKQLLNFLEIEEAVVCGYSTGGAIALEAMLTYPDRFVGGILISAQSEFSDRANRTRAHIAKNLTSLRAKRILSGIVGWTNSDMNITFNNLYKGAVKGDNKNIRQYYNYSLDYSCTKRLDAIDQPVLLLYGKNDTNFHKYAKLLDEGLRHRDLIFIEDVGHQIPTKAPRTMHRLLNQWMERHFTGKETESRIENFLQDVPDYLPDADTPSAQEGAGEIR